MSLHELIVSLQSKKYKINKKLKNVEKITEKLIELESMIGLKTVKEQFVGQMKYILMMKKHNQNPSFQKMHAILSGPPGVGKTTTSILIAEIWSLLELMDKKLSISSFLSPTVVEKEPPALSEIFSISSPSVITTSEIISPPKTDLINSTTEHSCLEEKKNLISLITSVMDLLSSNAIEMNREFHKYETVPEFFQKIYTRTHKCLEICDIILKSFPSDNPLNKNIIDLTEHSSPEEHAKNIISSVGEIKKNNLPYIVLGREDFIGAYQGHTSIKTKEVLDANKGKIIIIEEAYLLSTGKGDSYGMEALTLINRYMDEHVNDYIFIFNGYADKLHNTIFKAQPGLERRFKWTFNIEKYTNDEIYQIFLSQLNKENQWEIKDEEKSFIKEFFLKNGDTFPYYGGDTERLITFCKMAYAEKEYDNDSSDNEYLAVKFSIGFDIFKNAYEKFLKTSSSELKKSIHQN